MTGARAIARERLQLRGLGARVHCMVAASSIAVAAMCAPALHGLAVRPPLRAATSVAAVIAAVLHILLASIIVHQLAAFTLCSPSPRCCLFLPARCARACASAAIVVAVAVSPSPSPPPGRHGQMYPSCQHHRTHSQHPSCLVRLRLCRLRLSMLLVVSSMLLLLVRRSSPLRRAAHAAAVLHAHAPALCPCSMLAVVLAALSAVSR